MKQAPKNSKMISEHMFKSFTKIADFISQLAEVFGEKYHEIVLYNHLLSKTKLSNKQAISRNIGLFTEFCSRNNEAILSKDPKKIVYHRISYSEKVFIDLHAILNQADLDEDTLNTTWNHLLVIQATIDPTSEAREVLKHLKENSSSEGQFLDGFLSKIEKSIDKDKIGADPMSAATSILQSGVLNDLVGSIDNGIKGGTLDLGKLVGTVQQMLGGLSGMGSSGNGSNPMGGIDLSGMMGMVQSMMSGGMGGQGMGITPGGSLSGLDPAKMKEQIEARVESEKRKMELDEVNKTPSIVEIKDDDLPPK